MIECDVLVVGAGPAGSMAAKTAAEKGINVILIEEHNEVGTPVQCAEGVNTFIFSDTGTRKNKSFIRQKITGTRIYFHKEIYKLNLHQWGGYTLDRKIFDKYLAKEAECQGAKVMTGIEAKDMVKKGNRKIVKVDMMGKIQNIDAGIVIGAGGFGCSVGRWEGIKKPWGLDDFTKCLEYTLDDLDLDEYDKFHIAFGDEFPMGYGWIFPLGKHMANVGVGVSPRSSTIKALEYLIKDHPIMSDMVKNYCIKEVRGGCAPTTGPLSEDAVVSDRVILIGDAAGMVDPIMGEGITAGMLSGIAAGEVVGEGLEKIEHNSSFLKKYVPNWRNKRYLGYKKLGEYMDAMIELKYEFYHTFSDCTKKDIRKNLISILLEG